MRLTVPDPTLVPFALRAVKSVATAHGPMHSTQRSMIAVAQRLTLETQIDVDALESIEPAEWRRRFRRPRVANGSCAAW